MLNMPDYPDFADHNSWEAGFSFSDELKREVHEHHPEWKALHHALNHDDEGAFWSLIHEYQMSLDKIVPEDIVDAKGTGRMDALVERARAAVAFRRFAADIMAKHVLARREAEVAK